MLNSRIAYLVLISLVLLALVISCDKKPTKQETPIRDSVSPVVTIENPTTDASFITSSESIVISGSASDSVGVTEVQWTTDQGESGNATGLDSWSASGVPLHVGDNTFTISAFDLAGNEGTDQLLITRNANATFLGSPQTDPTSFYVDEVTSIRVWAHILPAPSATITSVQLLKLDASDNVIDSLDQLYDNGNLLNGDEILGDCVFSSLQSFNEITTGDLKLRVVVYTTGFEGNNVGVSSIFVLNVFEPVSEVVMAAAVNTQESSDEIFDSLSQSVGEDAAKEATVEWLVEQNNVLDAGTSVSGDIWVDYKSGLMGMVMTGGDDVDGGSAGTRQRRDNSDAVPVNRQTRGINTIGSKGSALGTTAGVTADDNTVLSKSALVCGPFRTENLALGAQFDFTANLNQTLTNSETPEFTITYHIDNNVTINALRSLTDFGLFAIHTHGGVTGDGNVFFLTGEEATTASRVTNQADWQAGRLVIATHGGGTRWAIMPAFITSLPGTFPNSIVYNGSCQSLMNSTMANAFINKGTNTYYGWSESVLRSFNCSTADELFPKLITEAKNTGVAFNEITNLCDGQTTPACFTMQGNNQTVFETGLVNGDFEEGDLTGWIKAGDGRVLTGLGNQTPQEGSFMGIISTGLGYTTATGLISQSFLVPASATTLSLDWNFLSEEFKEWVGNIFQDSLVILIEHDGQVHKLFEMTVDDIYYTYELVFVSPEIGFDQGDVWMTGWQTFSHDISAYAGEVVTLRIAAGDVGDSNWDTAILLDRIKVE